VIQAHKKTGAAFAACLAMQLVATPNSQAAERKPGPAAGLLAGAAKADITPADEELPKGARIRDRLFARAVVVRGGGDCAVLVGLDQGGTINAVMERALPEVKRITGCAEANVLISATHTHSGSAVGLDGKADRVAAGIVAAVREADGKLRPARIGYGTVPVDLNVNRDYYDNKQQWVQANNIAGPSDKTLSVVAFVGTDNLPIALYLNYAMHPVDFFMSRVISADFAGGASRHLEARYGGAVAIFSQGASGDQNPRLLGLPNNLMMAALGAPPLDDDIGAPPFWEMGMAEPPRGAAPAGPAMSPAERYKAAYDAVSAGVDAMSWVIGESAAQVLRNRNFRLSDGRPIGTSIWGKQASLTCAGRDSKGPPIMPGGINKTPEYADGAPVELKVGVLRIDDIYFASVNGEVYSQIGIRLKQAAPAAKLMVVTLANGLANSGYIYSNDASERRTFQVLSSRLKPGCAEDGVVQTALGLLAEAQR
jgi:hypothetical protein